MEPLYKASRLIYGNPESHVGIITLWTKAKELEKKVSKENYAVMGNLYSAERGLDLLVRNLLANPQITNIVVTGVDFSKSGIVLADFFEKGFYRGKTDTTEKSCWRVHSDYEGYIDIDIPKHALEALRKSINVVQVPDIAKFDFFSLKKPAYKREKQVFLKKEEVSRKYVGEDIGYIIRGDTIAECWLKVLDTVLKFGKVSGTHYDDQQKEVVNLMSIISEEDPYNLYVPDFMPSDEAHVKEYISRITRDLPGGVHSSEYTYGSRMRSWFGADQVKGAVEKLSREHVSRAVVINLWDSTKDLTIGGSPCLNHVWFRIRDNKLHMTCIFRSHDMFEGYPENAYGLRVLQEEIRKDVEEKLREKNILNELQLGDLIILSQSAHIYDDSWERCQMIVDKHLTAKYTHFLSRLDPRGNFIITIEDDEIVVEHTSPTKETLGVYRARTAAQMRDILVKENIISLVPHALDLGMELAKAETAIRLGIHYNQDNPLNLDESKNESPLI